MNHLAERRTNETRTYWQFTAMAGTENGRLARVASVYTERVASSNLAAPTTFSAIFAESSERFGRFHCTAHQSKAAAPSAMYRGEKRA